jgi:KTSC domain
MCVVKTVEWKAVDSSVFRSAGYRADARQLYLRFRDGKVYRYFDVPEQSYEAFLAAESKGRYFSWHIRHEFRYEQVRCRPRRTGR